MARSTKTQTQQAKKATTTSTKKAEDATASKKAPSKSTTRQAPAKATAKSASKSATKSSTTKAKKSSTKKTAAKKETAKRTSAKAATAKKPASASAPAAKKPSAARSTKSTAAKATSKVATKGSSTSAAKTASKAATAKTPASKTAATKAPAKATAKGATAKKTTAKKAAPKATATKKTTEPKSKASAKTSTKATPKVTAKESVEPKSKATAKTTTKKPSTKSTKASKPAASSTKKAASKPAIKKDVSQVVADADAKAAAVARRNTKRTNEEKGSNKPAKITPNDRQPAAKGQTKEEQAKKKTAFNRSRVEWFDQYMKGNMPSVYQMHISPNRDDLLSTDEQFRLAEFIQAGIAGKLLSNQISQELGEIPVHLQKTIVGDQAEMIDLLAKAGYTTSKFKRSRKDRRKLERLVQQAEDARNLFAEKNLGLVTMIAGRRKKMSNTAGGVDTDDLIAEGMNGLMVAIDHYNPATGFKFSTPAAWWIEQPIRNYLDSKTKTIHMPTHMNNIYKSIYYAERALREIYPDDSYITDDKIAEYCQSTGRDITVEKIKEARMLRRETVSFDKAMTDGDPNNKSMIELIASDENISEDVLQSIGGRDNFNRMLALIEDDKKREILRDWYSSKDMHDLVILSNVARKHCITKERVRALKTEAEKELYVKISDMAKRKGVGVAEAVIVADDEDLENEQTAYVY